MQKDGWSWAAELVALDEGLYRRFPEPWTQLRLSWRQGKITAWGDRAALLGTRMVSLDLTRVYLKDGRIADVQRLAGEMVAIFAAQGVHREATAALLLFQEAARREEVTAGLIRELTLCLEAARVDPGLRWRWGRIRWLAGRGILLSLPPRRSRLVSWPETGPFRLRGAQKPPKPRFNALDGVFWI